MSEKIGKCDLCGKKFRIATKTFNLKMRTGEKFFCSKECYKKFRRAGIIATTCGTCGKDMEVPEKRLKESKSGKVFCSKSCSASYTNSLRTGETHPNFKEGKFSYRKLAFSIYEHKCAVCGWDEDEDVLEVHHIDENRSHNHKDNLIILCPICHKKITCKKYKLIVETKEIVRKEEKRNG